jgi:hypothetical protein
LRLKCRSGKVAVDYCCDVVTMVRIDTRRGKTLTEFFTRKSGKLFSQTSRQSLRPYITSVASCLSRRSLLQEDNESHGRDVRPLSLEMLASVQFFMFWGRCDWSGGALAGVNQPKVDAWGSWRGSLLNSTPPPVHRPKNG